MKAYLPRTLKQLKVEQHYKGPVNGQFGDCNKRSATWSGNGTEQFKIIVNNRA